MGWNKRSNYSLLFLCENCEKVIIRRPSEIVKKHIFCSTECKGKWQSENIKGEKHPLYRKPGLSGANNGNYEHYWTIEQRQVGSKRMKKIMEDSDKRYKAGNANRNKKISEQIRKNMSIGQIGIKRSPHTEKSRKLIGEKSKTKFTSEFNKKFRKTMEDLGYWTNLSKKSDWEIYFRLSNWISNVINYLTKEQIDIINISKFFNTKKNSKGVVRDHMYSRQSGFENSVFPEILRHPCNCDIITHSKNSGKRRNRYIDGNSQSLENLFLKIKNFDRDWFEQDLCLELINKYENGERWKRKKEER